MQTSQSVLQNSASGPEPLHEDLRPYFIDCDPFPMIRHPLIYSVPHFSEMNAFINANYAQKKKWVAELRFEERYSDYVFAHEKPYRIEAFTKIHRKLNDECYWELLSSIWVNSENIWQNISAWKKFLNMNSRSKTRMMFMNDEDRSVYNELPSEIKIYRGYIEGQNKNGFSYTLDKKIAQWFANRFGSEKARVIERTVNKSDVFAYTDQRNEKEIIVLS